MNDAIEAGGTLAAQPYADVEAGGASVRVLGTAHVSRASVEAVVREIAENDYDVVAVELCASRYRALDDPDAVARMDLFQVIREGKAPMITAMLAMGAFQQRIAEQLGIEPGAEMKAAMAGARESGRQLEVIDREIGITLRRIYRNVPWWKRFYLFTGLLTSVVVGEDIDEEEIERLKEGDILETTFAQFAEEAAEIYEPLIGERDEYMAARLTQIGAGGARRVLAVVGAGHLAGIVRHLEAGVADPRARMTALEALAPPSRLPRLIPWLIVALILTGFGIGFSRSPELGLSLVWDWVLINGGLCALGALIAGGHVLTVISGFVAAPLTSLNPTIGAGMVTGVVEAWLRRPTVGDFSALRTATATFSGWRHNRVARTLLVFILSTLGSVIGTYVAGFRIGAQLFGG